MPWVVLHVCILDASCRFFGEKDLSSPSDSTGFIRQPKRRNDLQLEDHERPLYIVSSCPLGFE